MANSRYILGIDGGASYSRGIIFTDDGVTVSSVLGNGLNLSLYGSIASVRIHDMITELLIKAKISSDDIFSIGIGLAAASDKDGRDLVFKQLDILGISNKALIMNDAEAAYAINCPAQSGVLVTVGTGVICFGIDKNGKAHREAGNGHFNGDVGSGYWIGKECLMKLGLNESIVLDDPELNSLMNIVLKMYNNDNFSNAIEEVMSSEESVKLIASLAKDIIILAELGNKVALSIIQEGTITVSEYILNILDEMGIRKKSMILAGNGSVINNNFYRKILNDSLMFDIPDLAWTFSTLSSAYGAGILSARSKEVLIDIPKILEGNPLYAT